ncbi:MAG: hypothetical protein LBV04_01345 [Deferribacteraceae bacterium]|nr:hypothetical protein [Deferribacteraceae bacterium]
MKKLLILVFCSVVLFACSKPEPVCDSSKTKEAIVESAWAQAEAVAAEKSDEESKKMLTEIVAKLKKAISITIENVTTVESDEISAICKADAKIKITDEDAVVEIVTEVLTAIFGEQAKEKMMTPEAIAKWKELVNKELEKPHSFGYSVGLSEDKKSLVVEVDQKSLGF